MKKILVLSLRALRIALAIFVVVIAGVALFYDVPIIDCALAQPGPFRLGSSYRALLSGGHKRCYFLYVPSSYHAGQPAPVLFSVHGFMSDPYDAVFSKMAASAFDHSRSKRLDFDAVSVIDRRI